MKIKTPSLFSNAAIWFGAGVSIAEILTGTLISPLGFGKGLIAIISGHLIGCFLLFLAGIIGQNTHKSSMETTAISFGRHGATFFALLNVVQLIGWTSVMIFNGANAAMVASGINNMHLWSIVISILILIWIIVGRKSLEILNSVAMIALFILSVILCKVLFSDGSYTSTEGAITFGEALELSIAMPLSWLPLISDYTRTAKKGIAASAISAATYMIVSCWMYIIGMGAAIFTGESDIAIIMSKAGLGLIAILIVIFSTVTTTYLDVYSGGVSCKSISKRLAEKPSAVFICIVGTLLAIFTQATTLEGFLFFIGSVFAPMIAIQITDYFILKTDNSAKNIDITNIILWCIGFIIYRFFMKIPIITGSTIPSMAVLIIICIITRKLKRH